mmetsp:Transcript_30579/g.41412  ORF Transcript_30579/g.41412 Transcript_30579/m.41412 type:complete len:210 (+) Transcript_30579:1652-2281(+)
MASGTCVARSTSRRTAYSKRLSTRLATLVKKTSVGCDSLSSTARCSTPPRSEWGARKNGMMSATRMRQPIAKSPGVSLLPSLTRARQSSTCASSGHPLQLSLVTALKHSECLILMTPLPRCSPSSMQPKKTQAAQRVASKVSNGSSLLHTMPFLMTATSRAGSTEGYRSQTSLSWIYETEFPFHKATFFLLFLFLFLLRILSPSKGCSP